MADTLWLADEKIVACSDGRLSLSSDCPCGELFEPTCGCMTGGTLVDTVSAGEAWRFIVTYHSGKYRRSRRDNWNETAVPTQQDITNCRISVFAASIGKINGAKIPLPGWRVDGFADTTDVEQQIAAYAATQPPTIFDVVATGNTGVYLWYDDVDDACGDNIGHILYRVRIIKNPPDLANRRLALAETMEEFE